MTDASQASTVVPREWTRAAVNDVSQASPVPEPDWVREAWNATLHEVRTFARTLVHVTRSPRDFGRRWTKGHLPAMNPMGFLATSLTFIIPAQILAEHFLLQAPSGSWWLEALHVPFLYLSLIFLGMFWHLGLRVLGAKGALRTTVALNLFATSGPVNLLKIITWLAVAPLAQGSRWLQPITRMKWAHGGQVAPLAGGFCIYLPLTMGVVGLGHFVYAGLALSGGHRISLARTLAGLFLGFFFYGLLCVLLGAMAGFLL